jgi:acyl-coenzyme A synthetase/AMP-(fatty) acid ligase
MSTARTAGQRALEVVAEIPSSVTGKILRRVLAEQPTR